MRALGLTRAFMLVVLVAVVSGCGVNSVSFHIGTDVGDGVDNPLSMTNLERPISEEERDRARQSDFDKDGIPDSLDPDIDNDGIPNDQDGDDDNDGIPDSEDPDDDNDGIPDNLEK